MGKYENGAYTRQAIVEAGKKLFYEKGYRETGYGDICEETHVNRGTVYYHFPNKERLRYEVQWEYLIDCKRIVERYCPDPRYHYVLAMAVYWTLLARSDKMRKFVLQGCTDYPAYTGKMDISFFHYTCYEHMWGHFWDIRHVPSMSFSSVYGYVMSCMRMLCDHPEQYDPWELYEHCNRSSLTIWGVPEDLTNEIFTTAKAYFDTIPPEVLDFSFQQQAEEKL